VTCASELNPDVKASVKRKISVLKEFIGFLGKAKFGKEH
jgi:hypothetical protein